MDTKLYATIEGGGTKFICAVMDAERRILTEARFPCQNPSETIANCLNFFLTTQTGVSFRFGHRLIWAVGPAA
jgi:predicted NBD/HSP70 family sugar kinase